MSIQNNKRYQFNAFQMKMFMAMLMVLDHLPHIPGLVPPLLVGIFHAVTRCVGVWFAFNAVEGFLHTRCQILYNLRLFGWAAFMAAGNGLMEVLLRSKDIHIDNNIFLTLALGVLLLNIIADSKKWFVKNFLTRVLKVLLAICVFIVGFTFAEGGIIVIPFMLITYMFRTSPKKRNVGYIIYALILATPSISGVFSYDDPWIALDMILYNSDWLFITVLPFMYLYNGERGKNNKFTKYFFYVFYPAHLWIIAMKSYFA